MIGHGRNTVESLRELIAVPPKIEQVLLAFARVYSEEAYSIDRNLKFRQVVLEEFEPLVREGVSVADLQGEEEPELDAIEKNYAARRREAGNAEAGFQGVRGLHFETVAVRPLSVQTQGT